MKKDFLRIFGSNMIKMLVTFITAFIIPMVLPVEGYGYLKLYQFYASYLGISHLGFCDGIYLEYGGRKSAEIECEKISTEASTLLYYEVFIASVFLLAGMIRKDIVMVCLGLTIVPSVMTTFYTYVYQASGEFKKYTSLLNKTTVINLLFNLILVSIPVQNYEVYIYCNCAVQFVSCGLAFLSFKKSGWVKKTGFSQSVWIKYIRTGFLLMIGNFVYSIFLGIDKWFINFSMDIEAFSLYSFAGQMLTVFNMFMTPLAMTLYSNMSRRKDAAFENRIKKLLLGILMLIPMFIFVIEIIIKYFLKQYRNAMGVISVLLITQIFLCLNTAIFVNLYKVYKRQRDYFFRLVITVLIAFVLNGIVAVINANIYGFALATMVSCLVWLFLNMNVFKYLYPSMKEVFYVLLLISVYLFTLLIDSIMIRMLVYLCAYIMLTFIFMQEIWQYGKGQLRLVWQKVKRDVH